MLSHMKSGGRLSGTYKGQLGNDNRKGCQTVDCEIGKVIVGIMGAEEEEADGHAEQELLRRRVLVTVIDLLPHIEIIVSTGIEFEWDAPHPVEHEERAKHVADIGEGP